jgi:hypothetical protein
MLAAVKELRNRNSASMDRLGVAPGTDPEALRKSVAEALAEVGVSVHTREQFADRVADQAKHLVRGMELVHYSTDGLASAMDEVNQRLKSRGANTIF